MNISKTKLGLITTSVLLLVAVIVLSVSFVNYKSAYNEMSLQAQSYKTELEATKTELEVAQKQIAQLNDQLDSLNGGRILEELDILRRIQAGLLGAEYYDLWKNW